jgi:hypothetical protein
MTFDRLELEQADGAAVKLMPETARQMTSFRDAS